MLAPQAAISNWALHVSITKPLVQASIAILALLASIADFPSEPSSLNWPSRPQLLWWPALSQSLQFTIPQQSFPGFNCYTGPFCLNYFVNQVGRNGNADTKVPWPFQPQLPQMALQASIALLTIKVDYYWDWTKHIWRNFVFVIRISLFIQKICRTSSTFDKASLLFKFRFYGFHIWKQIWNLSV